MRSVGVCCDIVTAAALIYMERTSAAIQTRHNTGHDACKHVMHVTVRHNNPHVNRQRDATPAGRGGIRVRDTSRTRFCKYH